MYYRRYVRTLTDAEDAELQRMTQQEVGRVAERARMILLSARRYTVQDVMTVFEGTDDTVYKWLDRFEADGPEGLHDDERSGWPPEIDDEARAERERSASGARAERERSASGARAERERLVETSPLEEGYEFTTWTIPLLRSHLEERMGIEVSEDTVRRTLHGLEFVWRRPRWHVASDDPAFEERMAAIERMAALERALVSARLTKRRAQTR